MRRLARLFAVATLIALAGCDDGPLAPELSSATALVALTAGDAHACALGSEGTAYCWGSNGQGQLGADVGSTSSVPVRVRGVPALTRISAGGAHTCGVAVDGVAWCWGANDFGQLGRDAGDEGWRAARVNGERVFADVDAGQVHTCGLAQSDGAVFCWGANMFGQLGTGDRTGSSDPVAVASDLRASHVSAGYSHSCAVAVSGAGYCWGANDRGQLGLGHEIDVPTPATLGGPKLAFRSIDAGFEVTCALGLGGEALCWGDNRRGQVGTGGGGLVGVPVLLDEASAPFDGIAVNGETTSCGVAAGSAYCWGDVPGLDDVQVRPEAVAPSLESAAIAVGIDFVCVLDFEGVAYCWGNGTSGQLGDGRYRITADPVAVSTR